MYSIARERGGFTCIRNRGRKKGDLKKKKKRGGEKGFLLFTFRKASCVPSLERKRGKNQLPDFEKKEGRKRGVAYNLFGKKGIFLILPEKRGRRKKLLQGGGKSIMRRRKGRGKKKKGGNFPSLV